MDAPPVQYVTTSDGCRIAYTVCGEGRPLVFTSPNFHDTQQVWRFFPEWLQGLASRFRLIQYDPRGEGMSTRGLPQDFDFADFNLDLDALVQRLQLEHFLLWGFGGRGHIAIRYASAHPELVDALVLSTCAVSGRAWMPVFYKMLPNENWDSFLRAITPAGLATEAAQERVREYQRTVSLDDWNAWMRAVSLSSVEADLPRLPMPTLVMHPRNFRSLPAEESINLAARIPNARFVLIDGEHGYGDAVRGLAALDSFLSDVLPQATLDAPTVTALPAGLSEREIEVLRLLATGKSNAQIADELVISHNTVRRHVSNIFDKIGAENRAQAAVYARDHGLA
jgi:pimeloyl-ACP methyl ester carboxylesterase/DNA-binding CsgD family transcriptional regulator